MKVKRAKTIRVKAEDLRKLNKERIAQLKGVKVMENINTLNRVVTTKSFFKTHMNYSSLNEQEKSDYINTLSMEFISSARDLMNSLKDK